MRLVPAFLSCLGPPLRSGLGCLRLVLRRVGRGGHRRVLGTLVQTPAELIHLTGQALDLSGQSRVLHAQYLDLCFEQALTVRVRHPRRSTNMAVTSQICWSHDQSGNSTPCARGPEWLPLKGLLDLEAHAAHPRWLRDQSASAAPRHDSCHLAQPPLRVQSGSPPRRLWPRITPWNWSSSGHDLQDKLIAEERRPQADQELIGELHSAANTAVQAQNVKR